jgi:hypothetical protein
MTPDPPTLEAELRSLQATPLDDEALLARLEAAADGTLTELEPQELRFEEFLRHASPARITTDFLAELETIVQHVPFPINEKIVLFPKKNNASPSQQKPYPKWAAAAAVAIIGAASALLILPAKNSNPSIAQAAPTFISQKAANLVPASFNRDLGEVSEEGIVWKSNNQPHRVLRVAYKDQTTLKDSAGRTFQVEQPRVEYILVPAKTD